MKSILKISSILFLLIGFSACDLQNTMTDETKDLSKLTITELANLISKDKNFIKLQSQTNKQFSQISEFVRSKKFDDINLSELSQEQTLKMLGLGKDYWEKRKSSILKMNEYLIKEYKLDNRPEEEIKSVFKTIRTKSIDKNRSSSISDPCMAQFEDDIDEAHSNYDNAIFYVCPAIALATFSGPAGYATCSAGAVYKATVEVAQAIDDYNACKA